MPRIAVEPGVELRYRLMGTGARTLVLLHGWCSSGEAWNALLDVVDTGGVRLVVPDLRGSGESSRPASGYGVARHGRDVLALCDHVGAQQAVLVAHSLGGLYAQWLAASAPERVAGLVLLCPFPADGLVVPAAFAEILRSAATDREARRTVLALGSGDLGDEGRELLVAAGANVSRVAALSGLRDFQEADFADQLSRIRARTLVVACDEPYTPPPLLEERVTRRIPHARQAFLPRCGHYPHVERPHETAALLQAFLAALG